MATKKAERVIKKGTRPWLKIWRKTLRSSIYKYDPTAWRVFFHLLLIADEDTGVVEVSNAGLATELDLPKTTVYQALKRLKIAKSIKILLRTERYAERFKNDKPNDKQNDLTNDNITTIFICKWKEYQGLNERPNERPNERQAERIKNGYTENEFDKRENPSIPSGYSGSKIAPKIANALGVGSYGAGLTTLIKEFGGEVDLVKIAEDLTKSFSFRKKKLTEAQVKSKYIAKVFAVVKNLPSHKIGGGLRSALTGEAIDVEE